MTGSASGCILTARRAAAQCMSVRGVAEIACNAAEIAMPSYSILSHASSRFGAERVIDASASEPIELGRDERDYFGEA